MEVRQIANSAAALRFGYWLGRHLPPRVGYVLADGLTSVLARRADSPMVRTLRSNLQVVLGPAASSDQIDRAVRGVLHHAGRVYFDLYRALAIGPQALLTGVKTTPHTDYMLSSLRREGRGLIMVGGHISNFDLAALHYAAKGVAITGLAWATPTSGYDLQNQVRIAGGIDLLTIDMATLRKALVILRQGGLVATGIDRPDPFGGGEMIPFFGRPARMPVGHVRLALQANVPILVASVEYRHSARAYIAHAARWLEMERVGSREEDVRHNTRRVLEVIERLILAHPDQWLMFYPVWEEDLLA